jgi:hypothetical protein
VFPGVTKYTLCPALVDIVPLASNGTDSLEMFTQGVDMIFTEVYIDLSYRSDVDWGGVDQLMDALGGSYNDPDNCVRFGFGTIVFLAE